MTFPSMAAVALTSCFALAGCVLQFEADPPGISVQNDTEATLRVDYAGVVVGGHVIPPGKLGTIGTSGCDSQTLVVKDHVGGDDFARLTDERLCEDDTLIIIRGQNDVVIEE